jgi:hypothetical protein
VSVEPGDGPKRPGVAHGDHRAARVPRESPSPRLEAVVDRVGSVWGRVSRVWKALPSERRLAAFAAIGLFVTLFLPWYQETVIARGVTNLRSLSDSLTGWGAFSFVEAAVLLVAGGVLVLLFVRAEGEAFHVPGGDGGVITAAGAWTCVLIVWRMFDKEGTTGHGLYTTTSGIEWGIFVALAVAGVLTYAGSRIRLAHEPEPPLPGEPRRGKRLRGHRAGRGPEASPDPPSASGTIEFDVDDTWIQVERASIAPEPAARNARPERAAPDGSPEPASHADTRRRPRSLGDTAATVPDRPRRRRDASALDDLDISEPPTPSRLPRSAAPPVPELDPEDQLTLRLKRPD